MGVLDVGRWVFMHPAGLVRDMKVTTSCCFTQTTAREHTALIRERERERERVCVSEPLELCVVP